MCVDYTCVLFCEHNYNKTNNKTEPNARHHSANIKLTFAICKWCCCASLSTKKKLNEINKNVNILHDLLQPTLNGSTYIRRKCAWVGNTHGYNMYAYYLVRYVCLYLHSWKTKNPANKNARAAEKKMTQLNFEHVFILFHCVHSHIDLLAKDFRVTNTVQRRTTIHTTAKRVWKCCHFHHGLSY